MKSFDATKFLATELAKNLRGREAAMGLALMQRLRSTIEREKKREAPVRTSESESIGVWKACGDGGWTRQIERFEEWRCWADVEFIPSKADGKTRLLLIGESVARGYFFDPVVTPARLLQSRLESAYPGRFEVVDLARIDINQFAMLDLLDKAKNLEPDFVIFWGGNNWVNRGELESRHMDWLLANLDRYYEESHRLFLEELLPAAAERITHRLARLAGAEKTLMIVPDWNLGRWRNEPGVAIPFLPGGGHSRWYALREEAERALAAGDLTHALEIANAMAEIDGGSGADTFEIRAQVALEQNRPADARRELERARDALVGLPIPTGPRCPKSVQDALKRAAAASGMRVFDQRETFAVEGRERLFMDYCHLSKEGLLDSVQEIFSHVQSAFELTGATPESATSEFPPEEEALAHLLAAVHNAHHGQSDAEIGYHVHKAVEVFPQIRDEIRSLLDFINRRSPRWMCESFERLAKKAIVNRYLHPRNPTEWDKFEETPLNRALSSVLEDGQEEALSELMLAEHFDPSSGVDLLDYRYRARTFRSRFGHGLGLPVGFFRSCEPVSRFRLIAPESARVTLQITYRLAFDPTNGCGPEVKVDGHEIAALAPARSWTSLDIDVPEEALVGAGHEVAIHWPEQDFAWSAHRKEIEYCLNSGGLPNALPIFGEVFRFKAKFSTPRAGSDRSQASARQASALEDQAPRRDDGREMGMSPHFAK